MSVLCSRDFNFCVRSIPLQEIIQRVIVECLDRRLFACLSACYFVPTSSIFDT